MPKYEVYGTLNLNFSITVEADSEDEAEELAKSYAGDGMVSFGPAVEEAEIHQIDLIKEKKTAKKKSS